MSNNIIPLFPEQGQYDGAVCVKPECGGAWFRVEAICIGPDGGPTGYSGLPVCIECGTVLIRMRSL